MIERGCQSVVILSTIRYETVIIGCYTFGVIWRNSANWLPKHVITIFITLFLLKIYGFESNVAFKVIPVLFPVNV